MNNNSNNNFTATNNIPPPPSSMNSEEDNTLGSFLFGASNDGFTVNNYANNYPDNANYSSNSNFVYVDPPPLTPYSSSPSPTSYSSTPISSPHGNESFIVSQLPSDNSLQLPVLTISPSPSPNSTPEQSISPVPSPVPPCLQPSDSPNYDSSPSQSDHQNKKRKQGEEDSLLQQQGEWTEYLLCPEYYQVHDSVTLQPITQLIDVTVQQQGSKFSYSTAESVCICYRQNQFKVICLFRCLHAIESMCINDRGLPLKVSQICAKLYAINEVTGVPLRDELRVGLHHAGRKRRKEAKVEVDILPFEKGKIEFNNLQFERSNSVKPPAEQTEYFRIVLAVYAKCQDKYFHIFSKISPKIVVRAQNPGFYEEARANQMYIEIPPPPTPATPVNNNIIINNTNVVKVPTYNELVPVNTSGTMNYYGSTSSIDPQTIMDIDQALAERNILRHRFPEIKQEKAAPAWQSNSDAVVHFGRVGINTEDPKEALHVQGNMLVTGTVYKPSDRRIKSHIEGVDSISQLENVRQLKIYDYVVQSKNERGVLAQELQVVIPSAVQEIGDVNIGGSTVPNLLVVNERVLLYENIGATQQLDKNLESEKENIINIDTRVHTLSETTMQKTSEVQDQIASFVDIFFKEDCPPPPSIFKSKREEFIKKHNPYAGLEEEYFNFAFSLFRMGPARTLFVVGNFAPVFWVLGALFMFSNVKERRTLGFSSLLRFLTFLILDTLYSFGVVNWTTIWTNYASALLSGTIILAVNYVRFRRILKTEASDKKAGLYKSLGIQYKPIEPQYKYLFF